MSPVVNLSAVHSEVLGTVAAVTKFIFWRDDMTDIKQEPDI